MLNNDYNNKINLRNKFYKKTINKINNINKSLELLNKYNKDINKQIGGTLDQEIFALSQKAETTRDIILQKKAEAQTGQQIDIKSFIDTEIKKINEFIQKQKSESMKKLDDLSLQTQKLRKNIEEVNKTKLNEGMIQQLNDNLSIFTSKPPALNPQGPISNQPRKNLRSMVNNLRTTSQLQLPEQPRSQESLLSLSPRPLSPPRSLPPLSSQLPPPPQSPPPETSFRRSLLSPRGEADLESRREPGKNSGKNKLP